MSPTNYNLEMEMADRLLKNEPNEPIKTEKGTNLTTKKKKISNKKKK